MEFLFFVIDEKEGFWGVLDLPVVGVAVNKEGNEVRFLLDKEAVMKSFPPEMLKQVKFFEDPKTKTVTFGKPQIAKAVRDSRIKNGKRKSKK